MSSPKRLAEIFRRVNEAPPAERQAALERECAGDPELRREIEELLRCDSIDPTGAISHPLDGPPLVAAESMEAALSEDHSSEEADCQPAGTIIDGQFRIVRPIGRGGSGSVVYLVEQLELKDRPVALKILEATLLSPRAAQRFDEECEALAGLSHPSIATIYSNGKTTEDRPYFVMEFVSRQTGEPALSISKYVKANKLTLHEKIELFLLVCDAVQHAHQKGIVHSDLKPSNLLVEEREGRAQPKVIDFGIARNLDEAAKPIRSGGGTTRTFSREISGTPAYMSPEQAAGLRIDIRSDIYSLGVVLYELLCGRVPIETEGLGILEALAATLEHEPLAPSQVAKRSGKEAEKETRAEFCRLSRVLRGDLDTVILRSLEKQPESRFASVDAFAKELQRFLAGQPIESRKRTLIYTLGKLVRRHRAFASSVVVVFLALAASTLLSLVLLSNAAEERTRAEAMAMLAAGAQAVAEEMATLANLRNAQHALENEEGEALQIYLGAVPPVRRGWEWNYLNTAADRSSRRIDSSGSPVSALAVDGQGERLLCGDRGGISAVWSLPTLQPLTARVSHPGRPGVCDVWSVAWSPDGRSFATSSFNGTVNLWRAEDGSPLRGILPPPGTQFHSVYSVAFSPGSHWLFVGAGNPNTTTWSVLAAYRVPSGEYVWRDSGKHSKPISDLAFTRDGRWLASASEDETVQIWNLDGDVPVHAAHVKASDTVNAVAFSPDERWLAVGTHAREVELYPLEPGRPSNFGSVHRLIGHRQPVASVAFHSDGVHLASGGWDSTIRIWSLPESKAVDVLCGHEGRVNRVLFTPDHRLISCSNDGTVRDWGTLPVPRHRRELTVGKEEVKQIECLFDGSMVIASKDRGLCVFDLVSREEIEMLGGPGVERFKVSPDGSTLAWIGAEVIETWRRDVGVIKQPSGPAGWRNRTICEPGFVDDEHLVCAGDEGLFVLDLRKGAWNRLGDLPPLEGDPSLNGVLQTRGTTKLQSTWCVGEHCYVFGERLQAVSDKRAYYVYAASHAPYAVHAQVESHALIVYDGESGAVCAPLLGHSEQVRSISLSYDRTRLASIGRENMLRIWDWRGGVQTLALRHPDSNRQVPGERGPRFTAVAWSRDGKTLVTGSTNGVVHFWPSQRESAR